MTVSYTLSFCAHNAPRHELVKLAKAYNKEAAYQMACALNYTGFSWMVIESDGAMAQDITQEFEERIRQDQNLPVKEVVWIKYF